MIGTIARAVGDLPGLLGVFRAPCAEGRALPVNPA
jgi:hypothetical protein